MSTLQSTDIEDTIVEEYLRFKLRCTNVDVKNPENIYITDISKLPPERVYREIQFSMPYEYPNGRSVKDFLITESEWMVKFGQIESDAKTLVFDTVNEAQRFGKLETMMEMEQFLEVRTKLPLEFKYFFINEVKQSALLSGLRELKSLTQYKTSEELPEFFKQNKRDFYPSFGAELKEELKGIDESQWAPVYKEFLIKKNSQLQNLEGKSQSGYETFIDRSIRFISDRKQLSDLSKFPNIKRYKFSFIVRCYEIHEYIMAQIFSLINTRRGFTLDGNDYYSMFNYTIEDVLSGRLKSTTAETKALIPRAILEEAIARAKAFYDFRTIVEAITIVYDSPRDLVGGTYYRDIKTIRKRWNAIYHKIDSKVMPIQDRDQFDAIISMNAGVTDINKLYMPRRPKFGDIDSKLYKADRKEIRAYFGLDLDRRISSTNTLLLLNFIMNKLVGYYNKLDIKTKQMYPELKKFEKSILTIDDVYNGKDGKIYQFNRLSTSMNDEYILQFNNLSSYFFDIYEILLMFDANPMMERFVCYYFDDCKLPISKAFLDDTIAAAIDTFSNYFITASRPLASLMIDNFLHYFD